MQCVVTAIFISMLNSGIIFLVSVDMGGEKTEKSWLSFRTTWMSMLICSFCYGCHLLNDYFFRWYV